MENQLVDSVAPMNLTVTPDGAGKRGKAAWGPRQAWGALPRGQLHGLPETPACGELGLRASASPGGARAAV